MSNDFCILWHKLFAKPLNDAQMCGGELPQVVYIFGASFPQGVGCSKSMIFFGMVLMKNDIVNS